MSPQRLNSSQCGPALVIDGKTLGFIEELKIEKKFLSLASKCDSLVCVRATPLQKVTIYSQPEFNISQFL